MARVMVVYWRGNGPDIRIIAPEYPWVIRDNPECAPELPGRWLISPLGAVFGGAGLSLRRAASATCLEPHTPAALAQLPSYGDAEWPGFALHSTTLPRRYAVVSRRALDLSGPHSTAGPLAGQAGERPLTAVPAGQARPTRQ